jgi:hypothetical protein
MDFPLKMVIFHSYVKLPEGILRGQAMMKNTSFHQPSAVPKPASLALAEWTAAPSVPGATSPTRQSVSADVPSRNAGRFGFESRASPKLQERSCSLFKWGFSENVCFFFAHEMAIDCWENEL